MSGAESWTGRFKLVDVPPYEALLDAVKRAYGDVNRGKYRLKDLALMSILVFTGCRLGEAHNIVYKFTKRYLKRKIRRHAIRYSYAIAVLKATKNIEVVRRLLGRGEALRPIVV